MSIRDRKVLVWPVATLLAGLMTLSAQAGEKVVYLYDWEGYFEPSVIDEFTRETGIKVVYDVYDSEEMLETKLLAGGSGYDVVVPSANFLARQIGAGVFQKLDKSKLPNISNMWDFIQRQTARYDPDNSYSVNYMWGTLGLGYNVKKVQAALGVGKIDSWSYFLDPEKLKKLADCGVYVLDSPTDVLPVALNYLGLSPQSTSQGDLIRAKEVIQAVRPYFRKFGANAYMDELSAGDICIATGWSGALLQARRWAEEADSGVTIAYAVPVEGTEMWFDQLAIPADAQHVDEAYAFINYLMRPDVAARNTNFLLFPNGNKASQKFIDQRILSDPSIYPDEATLKKLFTVLPYDPKTQRIVTRAWTEIVTGQ